MFALKPEFFKLPTLEVTEEKPEVYGNGTLINILEVTRSKYSISKLSLLNKVACVPMLICLCVSQDNSGLPAELTPHPGAELYRLVPTVAKDW
jgi:hypothetical protein